MSDLEQQLFDIEIFGFTLVRDVLSAAEVAAIRAVNERLLNSDGEDPVFHGRAGHITNLPTLDLNRAGILGDSLV